VGRESERRTVVLDRRYGQRHDASSWRSNARSGRGLAIRLRRTALPRSDVDGLDETSDDDQRRLEYVAVHPDERADTRRRGARGDDEPQGFHRAERQRRLFHQLERGALRHLRTQLVSPATPGRLRVRLRAGHLPVARWQAGVRLRRRHDARRGEPLAYGKSISEGAPQCDSAESGITCRDTKTGHGFSIAREAYTFF
jgi:hypothetical protein